MKERKIFISHSSYDESYGLVLSNLFRDLTEKNVFFSSSDTQGVPVNEDIYQTLKAEIQNNAYVFCLLSKHYYTSPACLNEMGAVWALENEYALLCLPGFDLNCKDFRRSFVNIHKKVVHIENLNEMFQLAHAVLKSFGIEYNNEQLLKKCSDFTEKIMEISKQSERLIYKQLWQAEIQIKKKQNVAKSYCYRGNAWTKLKKYENAISDYLFSIFLDPEDENAYYYLVLCAENMDRTYKKRALAIAQYMCEKFPENHLSYGCRAYAQLHLDNIDEAIEDCNKAIAIKKNRWYYNTRGCCWMKKQKTLEALSDFWQSHLLSLDYVPPIEHIKKIVTDITPEVLKNIVSTQKANVNADLDDLYLNCLNLFE